jgi:protein required for attachment to host cells
LIHQDLHRINRQGAENAKVFIVTPRTLGELSKYRHLGGLAVKKIIIALVNMAVHKAG